MNCSEAKSDIDKRTLALDAEITGRCLGQRTSDFGIARTGAVRPLSGQAAVR
jgi:hypothetical protein